MTVSFALMLCTIGFLADAMGSLARTSAMHGSTSAVLWLLRGDEGAFAKPELARLSFFNGEDSCELRGRFL